MGALILPKRFHPDFRLPGVKPVGEVEVDWSNPLARGLAFLSIGRRDIVSDTGADPVAALSATQSDITSGQHGNQLESHSITDGGFRFSGSKDSFASVNGSKFITVAALAAIDSAASFGKFCAIPWHVTNWASPWVALSFERASSGTNCNLSFAFGGALKTAVSGIDYFQQDGIYRLYSATKNDTLTAEFYRDGVPFSSGTGPAGYGDAIGLSSQRNLYTFSRNDAASGEGTNGRIALIAIWARELSAGEHAELHADTYALLRPKVPPIYLVSEANGPSFTPRSSSICIGGRF